jgi:hypothetical protein
MTPQEYGAAFPYYCRKCQGWGVHKGFSPNVHFEECSSCLSKDTCPRCGAIDTLDASRICSRCHWDIDDKTRGLPGSNVV